MTGTRTRRRRRSSSPSSSGSNDGGEDMELVTHKTTSSSPGHHESSPSSGAHHLKSKNKKSLDDVHCQDIVDGPCLKGDYHNVALLVFLYILQGIPLGLGGSIPLILQNRKATYAQQAIYSFVHWPFSIKLLWAPIVDSVFNARIGRRKSWLVPVQYLLAMAMFILSYRITDLLSADSYGPKDRVHGQSDRNITINGTINANATSTEDEVTGGISNEQIYWLSGAFVSLNFLAATQDIAVDGWALTMLLRRNVGYASTCNTVGQTIGYFLGNVVFLALESGDFCHRFLWFMYSDPKVTTGLIDLSGFLYFWAIIFFITTTLVMMFKRETDGEGDDGEPDFGVIGTYKMMVQIMMLPTVKLFLLVLFTCKVGFAVNDSISGLKLIEFGVKKENLAMMAVPMIPLQVILPWVLAKYTAGPNPLNVFLAAYPPRLLFGLVSIAIVYWTSLLSNPEGDFPVYYYVILIITYALHQVTIYAIYVALMAFHAKTADPAIGGTYMTLLNTLTNLGGNWPSTLALSTVDMFNIRSCSTINDHKKCVTTFDGYYSYSVICVIIGFIWLMWGKPTINRLQRYPSSAWKVKVRTS